MYARVPWLFLTGSLMATCWIYMTIYYHNHNLRRDMMATTWKYLESGDERRMSNVFSMPRYPPPTRLANLTDFEYNINPNVCGQDDVYMLVLVGSHPRNVRVREIIRQTWGNPRIEGRPFKVAFMFGNLMNPEWQRTIEEESCTYHDIVQGNFVDSYRNMSYRDVMGLRWAWQFCGQASYIMHVDDDVSLDVYELTRVLERDFDNQQSSGLFMGCAIMLGGAPVHRRGKYEVSVKDYPATVYGKYCSGWTYVVTPAMAYLLDVVAVRVPTLWLNDAFITGVLVGKLDMVPHKLNLTSTLKLRDMVAMSEQTSTLPLNYSLGYIAANEKLMKTLHLKYEAAYYKSIT